ncbi:MAG: hypothetical protein A3F90_01405 [Deltaproteobacteria bacterium RIFCSPLOWO2_12_FULL_60_19]|nr:MAG: hypothetical protein A3F90_01405 [Deltaproteobacteria bacterium RIFCSPLOWO2_12_FULL_60_19]
MNLLTRSVPLFLLVTLFATPASPQQKATHPLGSFEWQPANDGILISASHGTFDRNTAAIAIDAARRLKAGYVVARGFSPGVRINVNRPTEGASLPCAQEPQTTRAREIHAEYDRLVALAAGNAPLRLYMEVHGNSRKETSGNLEVATKGILVNEAAALKSTYAEVLAAVKAEWPDYPALQLLIEPVDRLYWTASCGKRLGTMAGEKVPRVLHFEFPAAARADRLIPAAGLLVAGVIEVLSLHSGPAPSPAVK